MESLHLHSYRILLHPWPQLRAPWLLTRLELSHWSRSLQILSSDWWTPPCTITTHLQTSKMSPLHFTRLVVCYYGIGISDLTQDHWHCGTGNLPTVFVTSQRWSARTALPARPSSVAAPPSASSGRSSARPWWWSAPPGSSVPCTDESGSCKYPGTAF